MRARLSVCIGCVSFIIANKRSHRHPLTVLHPSARDRCLAHVQRLLTTTTTTASTPSTMALLQHTPLAGSSSLALPPAPVAHPLTLQQPLHLSLPVAQTTPLSYGAPYPVPLSPPRAAPLLAVPPSVDSDRDARLEKAVALVNNNNYSVRKAAQALSLPKSTVHRYLQATRSSESLAGVSKRARRGVTVYRELARSRSVGGCTESSAAFVNNRTRGKCDIAFLLEGSSGGSGASSASTVALDDPLERVKRECVPWSAVEVASTGSSEGSSGRNLRRIWT